MRHDLLRLFFTSVALTASCASMSNRPPAERPLADACDDDDFGACAELGDMLLARDPLPGVDDHAIDRFRRACEGGYARGCARAGLVYAVGHGVPEHMPTAARYFEQACGMGRGRFGCVELARLAFQGIAVPHDDARAARLALQGCLAGDPAGCGLAGEAALRGRGAERDPARAIELLDRACEGRDGDGCVSLARAYERGDGVTADVARAVRALHRGCAADHAESCGLLGEHLERGEGLARDDVRASEAALRACALGFGRACTNLGVAYATGTGVGLDPRESRRRFERACALHDALGCDAAAALGAARVGGGAPLSEDLLDLELRRGLDAVETCHRRIALATAGVVSVRFVVGRDGAVAASTPLGGNHPSPELAACVAGVVRSARFASPGADERLFDAQFHLFANGAPPAFTVAQTTADAPPPAVGAPPIRGLLSPNAIRSTVLAHLDDVTRCHTGGIAARSDASGRVVIRFVIAHDGAVVASSVGESTYPVPSVPQCIADATRRWRFPAPAGGGVVTVNYPFNLEPPPP